MVFEQDDENPYEFIWFLEGRVIGQENKRETAICVEHGTLCSHAFIHHASKLFYYMADYRMPLGYI